MWLSNVMHGKKISKLFCRSLLSYTCVFFLPILVCSYYYFHSYCALKERTRSNQRLILENAGEQINAVFADAVNLASHLQLNRYVIALSNDKATFHSSSAMDRYYLKKDLLPLQISNALIQRINVYFPSSGYIVNAVSTYDKELLSYMDSTANMLSQKDWDAILEKLAVGSPVCYAQAKNSFLTVAMPLLSTTDGKALSILCIQIDKKGLQDILESRLLPEYPCAFLLADADSVLLSAQSAGFEATGLPVSEIHAFFSEDIHKDYFKTGDSQQIADSYPLWISGTSLLFAAQRSGYQAQLNHVLLLMLLSLLVCVLLGIIVIMYLTRKNYEPISQIMHYIHRSGESLETESNEYRLIMKVLDKNRTEIQKQRELLKNNYLQKILTGEIPLSRIPDPVARQLHLELLSPFVCVVLLSVEEAAESGEIPELTSFIIRNVYQELLSGAFPDNYFCARRQRIAVLISVPQNADAPSGRIGELTGRLLSFLADTFQLSLRAGISGILNREQIPDAWLQADTALEYGKLFETGMLCAYNAVPKKQTIGSLPLNTSEYVIHLVIHGQQAQIAEYFDTLQKELKKNELSWADAKSCYYFFYYVTASLQLYCQTHYGIQPQALEFLDEDYFAQSLPSAFSQIREAYLQTCGEIAQKGHSAVQWGHNICRFIENNYFDANLNLNSVAAHFQISPSYLSRKFREQYQKSVVDYLYEVRIANSLPLLAKTDLKIADIARMTGFVDSNAFIRIFKKRKGVTPGKFREMQPDEKIGSTDKSAKGF